MAALHVIGTTPTAPGVVRTGDKIRQGDLLARLGGESDAAYAAALLELANTQQALKDLNESADEMRARSLIAVDDAQEAYDKAVDYYDSLFKPYKFDELVYVTHRHPPGSQANPTDQNPESGKKR